MCLLLSLLGILWVRIQPRDILWGWTGITCCCGGVGTVHGGAIAEGIWGLIGAASGRGSQCASAKLPVEGLGGLGGVGSTATGGSGGAGDRWTSRTVRCGAGVLQPLGTSGYSGASSRGFSHLFLLFRNVVVTRVVAWGWEVVKIHCARVPARGRCRKGWYFSRASL